MMLLTTSTSSRITCGIIPCSMLRNSYSPRARKPQIQQQRRQARYDTFCTSKNVFCITRLSRVPTWMILKGLNSNVNLFTSVHARMSTASEPPRLFTVLWYRSITFPVVAISSSGCSQLVPGARNCRWSVTRGGVLQLFSDPNYIFASLGYPGVLPSSTTLFSREFLRGPGTTSLA